MSSAILYVAIVAIWAAVLMPRWLRPRSAATGEATDPVDAAEPVIDEEAETGEEPLMVEVMDPVWVETASPWSADAAWERIDEQARDEEAAAELTSSAMRAPQSWDAGAGTEEPAPRPREHPNRPPAPERAPVPASVLTHRRARILRARRRMLVTLLLLTAVASGLAFAHLAALWVVVPPAGVLCGFLVLLREAAHSDAKQDLRRAQAARTEHRAPPARETERTEVPGEASAVPVVDPAPVQGETVYAVRKPSHARPEPRRDLEPTAQVIHISARIRGEVYDQYTDAAHRAVGD